MASAEKLVAPSIRIADRLNRISVSPTMAVLAAAEKLKAEGIDVADFGPGEPDFPTPDHIKKAAIKALDENRTKYTAAAGIAPLRQAICDWHKRELGSSYAPAECVVNVGGKHAIFQTICALVNSGDEVVIGAPYWVSYPDMVKYAGGVPVIAESEASDGFVLRAEVLDKKITPKTRIVIVNSPSNPSGAVIPQAEFEKILAVCKKHGVFLLSDECYSHFVYGDAKPYSIAQCAGFEGHVDHRWIVFEDFCDDRVAAWLHSWPEAARGCDCEIAEPIDVEPDFDRAVCGSRSDARANGLGGRHAR